MNVKPFTMQLSKIVSYDGNAVDISKVRSMQVLQGENGKHVLAIELIDRLEYIFNPNTDIWEPETINDTVLICYPDHEAAAAGLEEWAGIWQEYARPLGTGGLN